MLHMGVILLVIIFLILLQYYMRNRSYNWRKLSEFPGDPSLPLIGNALQIGFDSDEIHTRLFSMWKRNGKQNFRLNLGFKNWIMLSNPADVEMLLNNTKELIKPSPITGAMRHFFGNGVSISDGERWRLARKLMSASLSNNTLACQIHFVNDYIKELFNHLDNLVDKASFDFYKYVRPYMLDVLIETLMGVDSKFLSDLDCTYMHESGKTIRILMENVFSFLNGIAPFFAHTSVHNEMVNAVRTLKSNSIKVIKKRREILRKNGNMEEKKFETVDTHALGSTKIPRNEYGGFIDNLLLCQNYENGPFSEEIICEEITLIIFAGHYLMAMTMTHALFCMAKYPEVQKKAFEEQKNVLKNNMSVELDMTNLNEMKYLEAVVKETLRFFPAIPNIGRELQNDLQFQDGRVAPAGTIVAVFFQALYHNEEVYSEPDKFNPERFFDPINKFAFSAFSAGPRSCIGNRFSWMTMKATLSYLLRRYEILPGDSEPQFVARVMTESKNGVNLKLRRRNY